MAQRIIGKVDGAVDRNDRVQMAGMLWNHFTLAYDASYDPGIVARVMTALKEQLEGYADLDYIKDVLLGDRENVTRRPILMLEPVSVTESDEILNREELKIVISIFGVQKVSNKDKQLVGDAYNEGLLDIENDVKRAIDSDRRLGLSDVIQTRMLVTTYDYSAYPNRVFELQIEVHARQIEGIRA